MPATPHGSTDRRVRRSRLAIRDAFLALVSERGYEHVTIDDVARRADIARPTFYAHYRDKNDLVTTIVGDLTAELAAAVLPLAPAGGDPPQGAIVRELFRHADANRALYRVVLGGEAGGRARQAYVEALVAGATTVFANTAESRGSDPRVAPQILARAFVGSLTGVLEWWLVAPDAPSVDEAVLHLMRFAVPGLSHAIGLSSAEIPFDESVLLASREGEARTG
jgi:AcrR family transcriptional regulator